VDTRTTTQMMNMVLAGRDTSSCALTWTIYELSKHPELEERLLAEIANSERLGAESLYDQVKSLEYMEAFLLEVLR
jgi:cytochrome P450